jgi:glycosyltransferase involved in cell wall biosynthesis
MSMAKAIIASDLDQIGSVLRHKENAWLVTPGDANELAAAIELLAADHLTRARLGSQARADVLARHTWALNAQQVLSRAGKFEHPPAHDLNSENSRINDARDACTLNRQV